MDSLVAFPDGPFFNEDLDFTQQILHQFSFPDDDGFCSFINPLTFCPNPEANMSNIAYSSNALDSNFHYNSQEISSPSSNSSGCLFVPSPNHENYYLTGSNQIALTNDTIDSKPLSFPNIAMEDTGNVIKDLTTGCLGKLDATSHQAANLVLELHAEGDKSNGNSSEITKKRPRGLKDAPKVYKNVQQSRKNRKITLNGNQGEANIGSDGQNSSTTCSSGDDNVSQDTNGKTRASRGAATDPQSLYARKRRERINERLRILQNLVPNGTKVDISTMLEEAVQYVKFLQLQIKLLSSDNLWMYAPIAYNGVDISHFSRLL